MLLCRLSSPGKPQSYGAEGGLGEVRALFADVCDNIQAEMCGSRDAISK